MNIDSLKLWEIFNMYTPQDSINLKNVTYPQIRLGIQGPPASGKTTSALTFPNVVVMDLDNGLTKYSGKDIISIPFYDYDWIVKYGFPPKKPGAQPNRRDAILKFL